MRISRTSAITKAVLMGVPRIALLLAVFAIIALALIAFAVVRSGQRSAQDSSTRAGVPVGILGDSDSHSYQDSISFPPGSADRGGAFRVATLQWPEVLARLRGNTLDFGEWGAWGTRRIPAYVLKKLGIVTRKPYREDYRYNLSVSGAECSDLLGGWQEVPSLIALMDEEPERWRNGIVIVRIGVNDFGKYKNMDLLARDPLAPDAVAPIDACTDSIKKAVEQIRARHPAVRFVLVGIFDNANWARYFDRWQSREEIANIEQGLDRYDGALRQMAEADPGIAFFDDRAWFRGYWGNRDENGHPAYQRLVRIGSLEVANTEGDAPANALLLDGHAGLAWNTLWAQAMVDLLNARFGTTIPPIGQSEMESFLRAQLEKLPATGDLRP